MKYLLLSFTLAFTLSIVIFFTLNKYGISWDEPIFFARGDGYISWILKPKMNNITKYWEAYSDIIHPPLRQFLTGATRELLFNRLKILDVTRAYRASTLFFVFFGVFALTYYAALRYGYLISIFCGIGLFVVPQIFYLANISSIDFSIAILWFIGIISVLIFKTSPIQAVFSGILIGITMLTKFNGVFLFIPVIGYMFYSLVKSHKGKSIFAYAGIIIIISFGMFFLLWPWLWVNPVGNMLTFLHLQGRHMGPMVWFMNKLYVNGPPIYPLVMFIISTPLVILIPFFGGLLIITLKGTHDERFLLLNAFYPFILLLTIPAAKYDGIRLVLPAYPFILIVAGIGIKRCISVLPIIIRKPGILLFFVLIMISVYKGIVRIHPYQSAYYNELVGGISGAQRLGFESDYWGSPYLNILPWMNKNKDKQFCVFPTTNPFYYYLAMGYLEPGVTFNSAPETCDYLIVLMRQGYIYQYPKLTNIVIHDKPVYSVSVDSVLLVAAYAFPKETLDLFTKTD